jgi:hypothetical protein
MATTVTDFLTKLGIRLAKTISATSDPTSTQVYHVINEISDWLSVICMQNGSELGRKTGTITLADGTAEYDDFVDDIIAPGTKGWLLKTNSRDEIYLTTEEEALNYSPSSSDETEPDKFYIDGNGNITFLQTPGTTYTAYIPYWYHQTQIAVASYAITGASKANPCVLTFTSHNFKTGDRTYIESVAGMTQLNGNYYTLTRASSTTVSLDGVNSTDYTTWSSAGTAHVMIPFNGVFDNLYIEAASIRFQNIEEYQQEVEQSWLTFLMTEAKKVIETRKSMIRKVQR